MITFINKGCKEIELDEKYKNNLSNILIDIYIYEYTKNIYNKFYKKTKMELYLSQKQFSNVIEFFISKYVEYKNILLEKQKKFNEDLKIIDKV